LLDTHEQIRCMRRAGTRALEDGGLVLGQQMPARMAVEQGLERDCPLIQLIEEIARARRHAGERDRSWLRKAKDPRREVSEASTLAEPGWPFADRHRQEAQFMLKALRQRPLLVSTAEVMVAAVRYVAIMLVFMVLLGQLAKVAL
jgi:hypothetical protein